jgi:hypothetical protein
MFPHNQDNPSDEKQRQREIQEATLSYVDISGFFNQHLSNVIHCTWVRVQEKQDMFVVKPKAIGGKTGSDDAFTVLQESLPLLRVCHGLSQKKPLSMLEIHQLRTGQLSITSDAVTINFNSSEFD